MTTTFTGNAKDLSKIWYTYHIQTPNELIYIGCDTLMDCLALIKLRRDPKFNPDELYNVILYNSYKTEQEGVMEVPKLIKTVCGGALPRGNKLNYIYKTQKVICVDTGMVFKHAYEASKYIGVDSGRMSYHLMGKKGYKTIKKMTFKYVSEN